MNAATNATMGATMVATPASRRRAGLLPWIFPALLLVPAADVLFSGRNLADALAALETAGPAPRAALVDWLQRAVSLLLIAASIEQLAHHARERLPVPLPLVGAFLVYWLGTVGLPAVFGAIPQLGHDLLYAPAVGLACCLATPVERDRALQLARDALALLLLAGVLLLPLRPALVADSTYAAGWLPGLPRLAGLTPHAVTQGLLAQVFLLLLWTQPYAAAWRQRAAWALGLLVLLLAQSKTAWLAFVLCALVLFAVRQGPGLWRRLGGAAPDGGAPETQLPSAGLMVAGSGLCLLVVLGAAALLSEQVAARAGDFLASEQGAQLLTLTGRDRIWEAALEEWRLQPVFGYGLTLWDAAYRAAIGLPHATHAHNQLLDDAARAGSVGVASLGLYAAVLVTLCLRHARASGGLALALGLTLGLRAIGEVPLALQGYGTELFVHLLLLVTLAAAATSSPPISPRRPA
jgi:O-antigen ligase